MSVIGYYVNCDDALCVDCFTPPDDDQIVVTGEITADDPLAIFSWDESDTPTHCDKCRRLIPHELTTDGYEYVAEAIAEGMGDPAVLAAWKEHYGS